MLMDMIMGSRLASQGPGTPIRAVLMPSTDPQGNVRLDVEGRLFVLGETAQFSCVTDALMQGGHEPLDAYRPEIFWMMMDPEHTAGTAQYAEFAPKEAPGSTSAFRRNLMDATRIRPSVRGIAFVAKATKQCIMGMLVTEHTLSERDVLEIVKKCVRTCFAGAPVLERCIMTRDVRL